VTNLVATFTTTGASVKVGSTEQVSGETAHNFTSAVVYTVTAADASTQDYTVTVIVAAPSKYIYSFSLKSVAGTINETKKTIAVTLPYGTDVTALVAKFSATGVSVKVGSTNQVSGTTANDFTNPVVYSVTATDASTQDYTVTVTLAEPSYSISGKVSGDVLSGIKITLSGAGSASTTTDTGGNYSFSGAAKGSYTITPSMTGYAFNPTSINATVNNADLAEQNFTSTSTAIPTYTIAGQVNGAVASGVTITLTGTGSSSTTTDSSGNYSFDNAANGSYAITASLSGYAFNPGSISITVSNANVTGQNFTSTIDYTGSYYGTLKVSILSGHFRVVINSYSATSLTGTFEDLTFGYGLRSISSGYISGNNFHAEGYDEESDTTLVASGTFSSDGLTLSGTFQTDSGISGTMQATKE
jgi:inhibitor of cysteine peptidase